MSLADVSSRMQRAKQTSGRTNEEITLVVVSKGRSVVEIEALYQEGHRDFGENRAQELVAKAPELPGEQATAWMHVVTRREAMAVRRERERLLGGRSAASEDERPEYELVACGRPGAPGHRLDE